MPRYRTAFYLRSRQALHDAGIDLEVLVGRDHSDRNDAERGFTAHVSQDRLENLSSGRVRWRRLGDQGLGRDDLLLLEHAIKNLDLYPALMRSRVGGPSVGLWGHGRAYSSRQGPALRAWKEFITQRADWFFAYTSDGARSVTNSGFPAARVTILNNTIDTADLLADLVGTGDAELARWCRDLVIDPQCTALFLGGVDARKDISFLLSFAQEAARLEPRFVLLIGGSGSDMGLALEAQRLGAPVRVLGRVDGADKAMALRAAGLLTIPSQIGLVAVDSFVSGRPIVTRHGQLHGPEADYLNGGEDSVWLPHDVAPAAYAREVIDLVRNQERLGRLQSGCLAKSELYTLEGMVEAFVEGVMSWAEVRRFHL